MNATRRSLLRGLAALPLAPVVSAASATLPPDPVPLLYAESLRLADLINGGQHATEAAAEALMEKWGACDVAALATEATTPAEAIASIEWARSELLEFGFKAFPVTTERDAGIAADRNAKFVLALLDGALGVLRAQGGVA